MEEILAAVRPVFQGFPEVKLAYLFGSQATGSAGPLSDFDFAVYLVEDDPHRQFEIRCALLEQLSRLLETDRVEVLVLNQAEGPELKYRVIATGLLLHEVEPFRLLVEPRILNEYFDFRSLLRRHGLTRA